MNLLANANFYRPHQGQLVTRWYTPLNPDGQPYYDTPYANVVVPEGWNAYGEHSTEFRPPWDPSNTQGRLQYEGKLTEANMSADYTLVLQRTYPERWHNDDRSWAAFKTFAISWGGIYQRVTAIPGQCYRASAFGMGWNTGPEYGFKPLCSWGCGCTPFALPWDDVREQYSGQTADALEALRFRVGLDPTGGVDPYAASVVWSPAWAVYNTWQEIATPDVTAIASTITFFLDGEARLRAQNTDRYWASPLLELVEDTPEPPEPTECPQPREEWDRRVTVLVHFDAPHAAFMDAAEYADAPDRQHDVDRSWDHAFWSPGVTENVILAYQDAPGRFDLGTLWGWGEQWYPAMMPNTVLGEVGPYANQNPPEPPDGGSQSCLPGLHLNAGDSGASDWYRRLATEHPALQPPPVKVYGTANTLATLKLFKDLNGKTLTVGRLSTGKDGVNVEGPNFNAPDMQAEAARIMNASMPLWAPHRAYVDVFEIINEQNPPAEKMGAFMLACMDIATANGYTVAILSYSVGVPEWSTLVTLNAMGVFAKAKALGHYLALHEYDFPLDNPEHLGQSIPGREARPDRGTYCLRYRWTEDVVGGPQNMPRVLITEVNTGEVGGPKSLKDITAAEWNRQMRWYLAETGKDAYVAGVFIYGWGALGGTYPEDIKAAGYEPTWYQMAVDLAQPQGGPVLPAGQRSYSQRNAKWSGIHLGASSATMGGSGCFVTSFADLFSTTCPNLDPGALVAWLNSKGGFLNDGRLADVSLPFRHPDVAPYWRYKNYYTWRNVGQVADLTIIKRLLAYGPTIIQVDFYPETKPLDSHFVLALNMSADGQDVWILDPWPRAADDADTAPRLLMATYGQGRTLAGAIFAALEYERVQPVVTSPLIGYNEWPTVNGSGAACLLGQSLRGSLYRPIFMGTSVIPLDYSREAAAGIHVTIDLCVSYSTDKGGGGTLYKYGTQGSTDFIAAAIATIKAAKGVARWTIGNEANNVRESPPGAVNDPAKRLTPDDVVRTYNAIRAGCPGVAMSPGALDPFNATLGDPRDWLAAIYNSITGAEFINTHGYIRGPDPALVGSPDKFADAPLQWQYLNYPGCITALLEALPSKYHGLPIIVSEFNHLWKTSEAVGDIGWVSDVRAEDVILAAYLAAGTAGFSELDVYRWDGDEWAVWNNGSVKGAVADILKDRG